jgi:hypothetical protein
MLSNSPGRRAARFLFEKLVDRSITAVSDKRFSLAGKLYEYIFDPVVEGNSALYNVGFHKCVTNLLYSQFHEPQFARDRPSNGISAFRSQT